MTYPLDSLRHVAPRAALCLLMSTLTHCAGRDGPPEAARSPSSREGAPAFGGDGSPRRLAVPALDEPVAIAGGDIYFQELHLEAGDVLAAVVEQRDVDLVLRLADPGGRIVLEVDSPTGGRGSEELVEVAGLAGRHQLEIVASQARTARGGYVLRFETRRPATDADRALVEADRALQRGRRLLADGAPRAAVEPLREAMAAFRRLGLDRRKSHAAVRLVSAYRGLGETELAYFYATAATEAAQRSGDLLLAAQTSRLAGWLLLRLGLAAEAIPVLEEARGRFATAGDAPGAALAAADLGAAWHDLGRLERAVASYEEALAHHRTAGEPATEASILIDLAWAWLDLHRSQEALEAASTAQRMYRELGQSHQAAIASAAIARAALQLGDLSRAEAAALDAVAALERRREPRDRVVALMTLGAILHRRGAFDRARSALGQARELAAAGGDARREGLVLLELGKLWLDGGEPARALELETRAFDLFVEAADPVGQASARIRTAEALRALGRPEEAWARLEPALATVEEIRTETGRGDVRRGYFAFRQEYFEIAIDLLMELHGRDPAAGYDRRAFLVNERRLARDLLEAVDAGPAAGGPALAPLAERELRLAADLRAAAARADAGTPDGEARIRRLIQELYRARGEVRRAGRTEARESLRPVTVEAVQRLLDAESLALVYALGAARSYLWAIDQLEATSHVLPPGGAIESQAARFNTALRRRRPGAAAVRRAVGGRLGEAILAPVAGRLGERRLVVVAEGALQSIPFAALPEPGRDGYLIERREVVVLPSLTALGSLRELSRGRAGRKVRVAAFADPVFAPGDPRVRPQAGAPERGRERKVAAAGGGRAAAAASARRDADRSALDLGVEFTRLGHTRTEAEAILAIAPGGGHRVAMDFEARREAVTAGALGDFTVLHFATHGLLHPRHPELSGLVLSLVDDTGRPTSGFLRSYEISRLDLGADLVVLSACETAVGSQVRGEGMLSLVRSFFEAGSPRVIGTLWRVNDRRSAALMASFYESYLGDGRPPAASLQRAQKEALADPARADPHEWAGFVYYGDWLSARAADARGGG